ncbi:MAG: hypothetical protein C0592_08955 [Marinilabiliales bacterium]|nr:MAG: hypothetical protein C0592_08955 [Marinilabiliales bacterium]
MLRFPFIVIMISLATGLFAQDTIVKLSGRIKTDVEVMKIDSDYVYYLTEKDREVNSQGRLKPKTMERVDVFEVLYENGTSELAYRVDGEGFIVEPDSMRYYVAGCTEAYASAHNRFVGPLTMVITMGASYVIKPYYIVAVPALTSAIIAAFKPKFPHDEIQGDYVNRLYILGYQDTKKIKKVKSSVFFGMAGLGASFLLHMYL